MQLAGLEPAHNSRLMAMPLPIGLQLLRCLRQDSNLQYYGPKPYASTNWATQAHGGCRTRTCIGVTLDGLADRSNDHSGNPPKGRVGFEPTKCVSTLILQTSPINRSGNDPFTAPDPIRTGISRFWRALLCQLSYRCTTLLLGFEPRTDRLTADRSTLELEPNNVHSET